MSGRAQLKLNLPRRRTHGGERRGAGRKPKRDRAGVSHHGRDEVTRETPVHVTLRVLDHVWNLRSRRCHTVVREALGGMRERRDFRVVHYSVQGNHLHFIVEADGNRELSEGMQGLSVRLAKGLNRLMGRRGKVFADRFHAHVLRTPAETRNALAYALLNHRSHMARIGERVDHGPIDPFSSAAMFDGWGDAAHKSEANAPVKGPETWLLRTGWRRRGLLAQSETPAARS
jgi:REP element-mobilizing transposase RayT